MSIVQSKRTRKRVKGTSGVAFDNLELFLLHLPTTIWYLVFCYAPMFGIIIAFKAYKLKPGKSFLWSLLFNSKWSGFENFRLLFQTGDAAMMFRNTIGYNICFIVLGIIIPVTLALMITELYSKRLKKVTQTAMFLPHFLSWVVVNYFVYAFLATDKGLVNNIARSLGFMADRNTNWYLEVGFWPGFIVFLNTWKGMGYGMVVYLASINGIDGELYEAAVIDGASKWQQMRYITLPLLRAVISIMFILNVGNIFKSDIGVFYNVTRNSGALASVTTTIDVYVYKALREKANYKFSSASALLQSVLGCITIIIANLVVKKIDPEAGLF